MNVLFIVTESYPDADVVFKRIIKGSKTEHTTWIRRGDSTTKKAFEFVNADPLVYPSGHEFTDEAYWSEVLHAMDFVIVYGDDSSPVTKWFNSKTKFPYDRVYSALIEMNIHKKPVKRRKPKEAEYSEERD
jgi:hypothetical protein